ncbi:phospholysine phosphohistidine inorganic pyrophosphate phosphatase-like isoform X1 [Ylistrum balloti]|uniref:phospholysine phosphohistidine inorganic pyrophosphate phosphatase-like isoform X1 n=1 Tax=Ylistrum balloti TaxID=509963 RepID=UPI0029058564|nr:phospholysine phosphohistidine inorganic pyrophosphate phosphatase-like isoform X1 [Ylistrum balloti]
MTSAEKWTDGVDGVLLDMTGVLCESGQSNAIKGSVDAVKRLKEAGLPVRFCTNETTYTSQALVEKMKGFGFDIKPEEVFSPIPAMCQVLKERELHPHLLVHPNALADFSDVSTENPNCVVLGDAVDEYSYDNLNKAFQVLISLNKPSLFSLGKGRYYKDGEDLVLDVGSFCSALEYACDIKAEVVGKPSAIFFNTAVKDMGLSADKVRSEDGLMSQTGYVYLFGVVMVGDDIVSDVGGALSTGMKGVLVRSGKYRTTDENHPKVKPSAIVNDLSEAVDILLKSRKPNWDGLAELA